MYDYSFVHKHLKFTQFQDLNPSGPLMKIKEFCASQIQYSAVTKLLNKKYIITYKMQISSKTAKINLYNILRK